MMTIEEFRATRREVNPQTVQKTGYDVEEATEKVLVYADSFYIERFESGLFYLITDEGTHRSFELSALEAILYPYAARVHAGAALLRMVEWPKRPLPDPPRCRGISMGAGAFTGCAYGYGDLAPFTGPCDCPTCHGSGIEAVVGAGDCGFSPGPARSYSLRDLEQLYSASFSEIHDQYPKGCCCAIKQWSLEIGEKQTVMVVPYMVREPESGWRDEVHRIVL